MKLSDQERKQIFANVTIFFDMEENETEEEALNRLERVLSDIGYFEIVEGGTL